MKGKALAAVILAAVLLFLFVSALLTETLAWPASGPSGTGVGVAMWESRTFEVLVQAFVLLGGVVAILFLLGTRKTSEAGP